MFCDVSRISTVGTVLLTACVIALGGCGDDEDDQPTADATEDVEAIDSDADGGEPQDGEDVQETDASPSVIPAVGVHELDAYRTGDCNGLTDEEDPFLFFAIEYDERLEDFLLRSCATAEECADGDIEDSINVDLESASDAEPVSIATSESYNSNAEECQLMVAERTLLVPSNGSYTWRLEDYRGKIAVDLDEPLACGVEDYDPAPLLSELDDCPSVDEWVGVRVE